MPSICEVVPVSETGAYLWQAVLWLRESGEFVSWPEKDAKVLHTLKQGIMGPGAAKPYIGGTYRGLEITRKDTATAYLAYVISYVSGWPRTSRPALFRGRCTRWQLNLGLPAENADNSVLSNI